MLEFNSVQPHRASSVALDFVLFDRLKQNNCMAFFLINIMKFCCANRVTLLHNWGAFPSLSCCIHCFAPEGGLQSVLWTTNLS